MNPGVLVSVIQGKAKAAGYEFARRGSKICIRKVRDAKDQEKREAEISDLARKHKSILVEHLPEAKPDGHGSRRQVEASGGRSRHSQRPAGSPDGWRQAIPVAPGCEAMGDDCPMHELVDRMEAFGVDPLAEMLDPGIASSVAALLDLMQSAPTQAKRDMAEREARRLVYAWESAGEILDGNAAGSAVADSKPNSTARQPFPMPNAVAGRTDGLTAIPTEWHDPDGWRTIPAGERWRTAGPADWSALSVREQREIGKAVVQKRTKDNCQADAVVLGGKVRVLDLRAMGA